MSHVTEEATITIDGQVVPLSPEDENIVITAKRAGIGIPAPCFLAKRKGGCCKGCGIEVDGKREYACALKATPGMNVVVNRNDLKEERKKNLMKYKENLTAGVKAKCELEETEPSSCDCSGDEPTNNTSCCDQSITTGSPCCG